MKGSRGGRPPIKRGHLELLATPKEKRASAREAAIIDAIKKSPRFMRLQVRRWVELERLARRIHSEWHNHLDDKTGTLRAEAACSVWALCSHFDSEFKK